MKILVYGCGALGSLLIHYLCNGDNEVSVVARSTYEELAKNGIVVEHVLQKKTTVDQPVILQEPDSDEEYDVVFSVMQGQQQLKLLDMFASLKTSLIILVGNNMDADYCEEYIRAHAVSERTVLFGFQNSAGHREGGKAVVARLPVNELVIGGLHQAASSEALEKIRQALPDKGCKVTEVDNMYGYYMYHVAEIMPFVYKCYRNECDIHRLGSKDVRQMMEATRECFDYLEQAGIKVMPKGEDAFYSGGVKTGAMQVLYRIILKTRLGELMVSDHCKNAVTEMQYLDDQFSKYRAEHPGKAMPIWDELRNDMPSWEELHAAFDKHPGETNHIGKPDYANWMPKGMVTAAAAGTGTLLIADIAAHIASKGNRTTCAKVVFAGLTLGTAACAVTTGYFYFLRRAFDYDGKRKLSKQIIDGIADYVTIPDGGTGLDVGCGSGALTIACAKRNPNAEIIGIDHWGPEYRDFTKDRCERNAAAEGVSNVRFQKGDAVKLDFPDEIFDLVTSNYVYHNITGKNKQTLLLESLRVLKKGGTFAIHDLMSKARYGDMHAFVQKLKDMGYENVWLIDTTDGKFMSRKEAALLGLGGSTLLVGKKYLNEALVPGWTENATRC